MAPDQSLDKLAGYSCSDEFNL